MVLLPEDKGGGKDLSWSCDNALALAVATKTRLSARVLASYIFLYTPLHTHNFLQLYLQST